jgi:hypothetical protein
MLIDVPINWSKNSWWQTQVGSSFYGLVSGYQWNYPASVPYTVADFPAAKLYGPVYPGLDLLQGIK